MLDLSESELQGLDPSLARGVVNEAAVEEFLEAKEIGARLKDLRLKRSMGLVELGNRSGLSASYLSQLETGRVVPTLRNLARIAQVHNVDLSRFFSNARDVSFSVSREKDRIRLMRGARDRPYMLSQSMASIIPDRWIVPCIAELLPGTQDAVFEASVFQGMEFAYVMQGSVSVTTLQRTDTLEETDVLWVDGGTKRQYKCVGPGVAKVMIITVPR